MDETSVAGFLIAPYGGKLVELLVPPESAEDARTKAGKLPSLRLTDRAVCDLEMLATGAFSPLDRFMSEADHRRVLDEMRLESAHIFPIPVTLSVDKDDPAVRLDSEVALMDSKNELIGTMTIEEVYGWDRDQVATRVFGTTDHRNPIVAEMYRWGGLNISGRLRVIQLPRHYDFQELRLTPAQTRVRLQDMGQRNVVAFQTRNPIHRVHEELTKRAAREIDGTLLIHPVVGLTKPGDVDHITRVHTYKALVGGYYAADRTLLAVMPLAMRMGGPREALWHALIRRNYGANHLIVGRDHAGPGNDSTGKPFYGPYDAQDLARQYSDEVGVSIVPFRDLVYLPDEDMYEEVSKVAEGTRTYSLSGTQVRDEYLAKGNPLPEWFTRPEIASILADTYPHRHRQGVCIWFTGLSGSGKSTTADVLTVLIMEKARQVTVLDGDVVRTHLSKGLGFSKKDRDTNILRIGYVASEIVKHGGVVVCAAISPFRATRDDVRNMMGADRFIEVFVDTPLSVCEERDSKGIYARARRGEIKGVTGIDDPYESPLRPDLALDTVGSTVEQNARLILELLTERGFIRDDADGAAGA